MGPVASPIFRIKKKYRTRLLLRSKSTSLIQKKLSNKVRGAAAIILVGLSYENQKIFTSKGLDFLNRFLNSFRSGRNPERSFNHRF